MLTMDTIAAIPSLPELDLPIESVTDPMAVDVCWLRPNGVVARFCERVDEQTQRAALEMLGARVASRLAGGEMLIAVAPESDASEVAKRLIESGLVTFCRAMRILAAHRAKTEIVRENVSRSAERSPWQQPRHRRTVRHGRGLIRRTPIRDQRLPVTSSLDARPMPGSA
jgi:hypothetical protein